ncbi:ADK-domain-containing protein [Cylindrobasidium torrendii FP15055 ss-10]|uniref:ADK-domain-containing protein n=1 Tax=Cylindrobasidium torrendii FP15055 ss-10 TaxID=1314674 RepID=A0A0D7BP37_9AGAR|nr:ADK-domain-containing protein [Cylindrobasidium torrendii FP15055 ss-10]
MQTFRRCRVSPHSRSFATSPPPSSHPFFLSNLRGRVQENQDLSSAHGQSRMLRMIMFGKPGAGKGTLSARLVKKYDILSLSAGDLLRQHIMEGTDIGLKAKEIVAQGGLVSDEIMLGVVTSKLDLLQNRHWILDGFPRTLIQGQQLDHHLLKHGNPLSLVVNIEVPDEIILSRISDRWVHLPSGRVYNLSYNRPKVDGRDDETGEALTKRPDDNPEIFSRRLQQFYKSTSPLLNYYSVQATRTVPAAPHRHPHQHPHQLSFHTRPPDRVMMQTISGTTSDEIWPRLDALVASNFPGLKQRQDEVRRHSLSDALLADGMAASVGRE